MQEKDLSIEEALNKLEEYAEALRSGKLTLDESIKLYEKSVELFDFASKLLNEAKQKIEIYRPETGEIEEFDEL